MARGKRVSAKNKKADPMKFSKKVVTAVLVAVILFTVAMTAVFVKKGAIPDSLVVAFFAFAGGEAGVLGLIRYGESKYDNADGPSSSDGGPLG